jgi:hypothetical protein
MYGDRNRIQDYRAVFTSTEGKRVLADLAARHWMFGGTLHAEPSVMTHREGERNVVLEIIRFLELKPDDLPAIRESVRDQFGIPQEA